MDDVYNHWNHYLFISEFKKTGLNKKIFFSSESHEK